MAKDTPKRGWRERKQAHKPMPKSPGDNKKMKKMPRDIRTKQTATPAKGSQSANGKGYKEGS